MKAFKVHISNLLYLAGIIAFFLVGIYPGITALNDVEEEITELNQKVETQELLYPVYLKLLAEVTRTMPTKLRLPERKKISQNDLNYINNTFAQLASDSGVSFVNAIPDARSYLEGMGFLSMNITFSGDFFDLRKLILDICRLPYVESIDEMRIETYNDEKRISFTVKVNQE